MVFGARITQQSSHPYSLDGATGRAQSAPAKASKHPLEPLENILGRKDGFIRADVLNCPHGDLLSDLITDERAGIPGQI